MVCLGTFAKHTVVNQASCVKILDHYPLDKACLVGCGVTTGWGSAVYAADVQPGDDVVVIGIGGLGASAIQGARLAGAERIFAIDPVPFKLEMATKFGATHTASSIEEALPLVNEVTWGKNAEKVICTMGVGEGRLMETIMQLAAKRGRVVVTNIHPMAETDVTLSLTWVTLLEKQIVGTIFGSANMRYDIPHLLRLYDHGQLDLDTMVTRTYKLEEVNQGYADMLDRQEHPRGDDLRIAARHGHGPTRSPDRQDWVVVAFGQQSGPPASGRQVQELLSLLKDAGHSDFRDARGPMGFTQRQAGGTILSRRGDGVHRPAPGGRVRQSFAGRDHGPRGFPGRARAGPLTAEQLAVELRRRGWTVLEP